MAGKSTYLENALINHIFRGSAFTAPSPIYVALFTATPSDDGGGTECTGNNYARVSVTPGSGTFDSPSSGATQNTGAVNFPTPSGSWGTATHWGIYDASTDGNLLYWAALGTPQAIGSGNTVSFAAGALDITED